MKQRQGQGGGGGVVQDWGEARHSAADICHPEYPGLTARTLRNGALRHPHVQEQSIQERGHAFFQQ